MKYKNGGSQFFYFYSYNIHLDQSLFVIKETEVEDGEDDQR